MRVCFERGNLKLASVSIGRPSSSEGGVVQRAHLTPLYRNHLFWVSCLSKTNDLVRLIKPPPRYFCVPVAKHVTPQIAPSTMMRHGSPRCAPGVNSHDRSGCAT